MKLAFGVALSVLIIIGLIAATVFVYLKLKKRHKERKVLNELITIGCAFLICFAIRMTAVIIDLGSDTLADGISVGFYVLYSTIGELSFEGIESVSELSVAPVLQCMYYGAIVYAAGVSLLIISTGISYEFFSFVELRAFFKRYDVLYLFTDVSPQSVSLALDIENSESGAERQRKYAVIFIGSDLEAFDRKDETHRTIMRHGFYYWSYGEKRTKSLIKKLRLNLSFCSKKDIGENRNKMAHVFALETSSERDNSSVIFDDIAAVLEDYYKPAVGKRAGDIPFCIPTVVNYYLSATSIDYEFYKNKLKSVIGQFLSDKGEDGGNALTDRLSAYFQLHILSGAKLSAIDMINRFKQSVMGEMVTAENAAVYKEAVSPTKDGVFRTAVFGFGRIGQAAAKELFIETSYLDENYLPPEYIVDAYDINAEEISGSFGYRHPLFLCRNDGGQSAPQSSENLREWARTATGEAIEELVARGKEASLTRSEVFAGMGFPIVSMHGVSCFDIDFMRGMDNNIGSIYKKDGVGFRAFIISLGDDELNINMANMLICDFKNEILLNGGVKESKTIFVNLKLKSSVDKIDWTKEDEQRFCKSLRVVTFGATEDIWSYSNIIDDRKDSVYNYCYNKTAAKEKIELPVKGFAHKDEWLKIDAFMKESTRSARSFGINYKIDRLLGYDKDYDIRLEHLRWNRFYMAAGWIYASYPKEEKAFRRHNRQHTCLCPFEMLSQDVIDYDGTNVELGRIM